MSAKTWHILLLGLLLFTRPVLAAEPPKSGELLTTVERRAFDYFWREADPATGLTKDRAPNREGADGAEPKGPAVASIAATGYMLAAMPIGVEHHWITSKEGYDRCLLTLRFVDARLACVHGFYYHFLDASTGARVWSSELSSIDSALLALGGLTAGEYWPRTEVERLAGEIAGRMDWRWMRTNGGALPDESAPAMGWNPERGFLEARWRGYSEACFLYLLALGTPEPNGLPASSWDSWTFPTRRVEDFAVFGGPSPIFMAQMTPGYFDLRGLRDRQGRDWWTAWRSAHRADQAYCARATQSKTYAAGFWAINAFDRPDGYGADRPVDGANGGTVSPSGMIAGILFTPKRSEQALADMWALRDIIWGRYGFCDAFNLDRDWYDPDVIGIDLGMLLLNVENSRTGLVWRLVRRSPIARRGIAAAGFH
ncbi:MAG TPA: glucoamylase family protein [Chthonomonadaceae bacterium]|nr:glucoamylase family protein [Chthonomonadaceae bacterium]